VKYAGNLLKIASLATSPDRPELKVICIVGPTRIGKSYAAHALFPSLYTPYYGNNGVWWDGYAGEKTVLIDEFRGQMPLQKTLQTLDRYPFRLETKGGSLPAMYTLVFVT